MRRGFLLTPREPGKASPPQASGSADPPPDASSPKVSKQSSLAASSTTDVVPIPTRYKLPPWLPDYVPDPFSGPICRLTFSFLPRGESRPELCTTFAHCGGMLDALLTQYPGWPLSFSPPPPVYEIVPIKGTGLGMVATADIAAGSTIVRERPFFVLPRVIPANSMEESLRVAESLVSYLDPENKRAFFALRNSKGHTTPSQVKGILDTNAFIAGPFPTFPAKYAGVARDISRVNHSCNPNAMHSFDTATLTHVLRAVHAIRAGEEVTISYLNDELGTCDARQKELCRRYLFKCKCKSCQLTGEARMVSDTARMTIAESAQTAHILQDEAAFRVWLAKGAMPGPSAHDANGLHPLETAEQLWRAMEQEGCYVPLLWELLLQRLVRGFATQENEQAVRHYARKAAELRMAHSGEDGGWLAVAENPRKTEGWAWRSERRKV